MWGRTRSLSLMIIIILGNQSNDTVQWYMACHDHDLWMAVGLLFFCIRIDWNHVWNRMDSSSCGGWTTHKWKWSQYTFIVNRFLLYTIWSNRHTVSLAYILIDRFCYYWRSAGDHRHFIRSETHCLLCSTDRQYLIDGSSNKTTTSLLYRWSLYILFLPTNILHLV